MQGSVGYPFKGLEATRTFAVRAQSHQPRVAKLNFAAARDNFLKFGAANYLGLDGADLL
jgi:hypothetical protein